MTYKELLTAIRAKHGELTPEIVREEARPEDSPLHAFVFDKAPDDAAEAYYLERAHELIQSVRVVVHTNETERMSVRAFLAVPSDTKRFVYEPVSVVMSDAEKFNLVLLEALRRLRDAERSVEELNILSGAKPVKRAKKAIQRARNELENAA